LAFVAGWPRQLELEPVMKKSFAVAVGAVPLLVARAALAQNGSMMNGSMGSRGWMGGYGGYWLPVVLVVLACVVAWVVIRRRK
jgi:uncharacterized membrane protein